MFLNERTREPQIARAATLLSEGNLENRCTVVPERCTSRYLYLSLRADGEDFSNQPYLRRLPSSRCQIRGRNASILIQVNDA
jgi:hypothetical protein